MPYWDNLGRQFILAETKDNADDLCWKLNDAGIAAYVSPQPDSDEFMITVPKDQADAAWKLLTEMWLKSSEAEDPDTIYRKTALQRSPDFVPSEEKFRYSTNSSIAFLISGILIIVVAVVHFFFVLTQRRTEPVSECILELFLGFIFASFGFINQQKVRMLEVRMEEENSFTNQIVNWFTTCYSGTHLDKVIDAASEEQIVSEEERFFLRRQLMQNYILREYDINDSAYLDFITDMIYKKLYMPNAVSAS